MALSFFRRAVIQAFPTTRHHRQALSDARVGEPRSRVNGHSQNHLRRVWQAVQLSRGAGLVGVLPARSAAQARAEALTTSQTASATRRRSDSLISGYMGRERTRLATASVTGNEPGPKPNSR